MTYNIKKYRQIKLFSALISFFIVALLGALISVYLYFRVQNKIVLFVLLALGSVVLFIFLFLFFTRKYRKRKSILKKMFPVEWELILNREVAYYSSLSKEEKQKFNNMVHIFLNEKIITGIDTDVDDKCRLLIASSAIIPVFKFPDWEYDNLVEILVYPKNFDENYQYVKNNNNKQILGLVTNIASTMILSKPALYHGFKDSADKLNVGFHEFIHAVDGGDGAIDGIPALLIKRDDIKEWLRIVKQESKRIEEGHSDINPYALTNNAEFFSVSSEYFFENPEAMSDKYPELYNILMKIFKQDTKSKLKSVIKSMFRPNGKKLGRNDPCPCGSGKKYKRCCLNNAVS